MLAVCLPALASCRTNTSASGSTATATAATTSATPTEAPPSASTGPATTFPLTGLPASGAAQAARPVLAVAVSGGPGLPAPTGLDAADLVYAIYPGAGTVRYVALYQSQEPDRIGPVGPAAPEDVRLLDIVHPLFAFNDGPKRFVKPLSKSSIVSLPRSAHPTAYSGAASDLVATPPALLALAPPHPSAPPILVSHSRPLATSGVHPAKTMTITVPGQAATSWQYDGKSRTWRQPGTGGASATNLIVQVMPYRNVLDGYHGNPVSSPVVVGKGTCVIVSLDQTAGCSWSKPGRAKLTNYVDGASVPLQFAPGRTWIALVPPGTTVKAG